MAAWEARREDVLEAIRVLELVGAQSGVPSSDFFLVEPGSNGQISLTTAANAVASVRLAGTGKWPYKEPFYVDRKAFSPFALAAKEIKNKALFEFSDEKGELFVRHGKRFENFSSQPEVMGYADLPKLKNPNKLVLTEEIVGLMDCAATCSASELQSPELACVFMQPVNGGVLLQATNQKVVFQAKAAINVPLAEPVPYPLGMMGVMRAGELKALVWAQACVAAVFPAGVVWQTLSQQARDEFPVMDIRQLVKASRAPERTVFSVSAYRFARVIERMCLYLQSVKKEDWVLTVRGKQGSEVLNVSSKLPHWRVQEQLTLMEPVKRDFMMEWPLEMLAPVFAFVGQAQEKQRMTVGLNKNGSSSYIRCGQVEMVVPARRA